MGLPWLQNIIDQKWGGEKKIRDLGCTPHSVTFKLEGIM